MFKTISVLGKGTFAKVYLIYLPQMNNSNKLYAMKSIRKDVIVQNQVMVSTELEKMIMLQVNHPFIVKMEFIF